LCRPRRPGNLLPMLVSYYVAMSLDGFIAKPDGDIHWLSAVERPGEDYGYAAFYSTVEAVLIGRATYDLCLSFPEWPYTGKRTIVFSRDPALRRHEQAEITADDPRDVVARLEREGIQKAWLVGGGILATAFRELGLIDEYIVSVIPVVLGGGIPMLAPGGDLEPLRLQDAKSYPSGLVQLTYARGASG